MANGVMTVVFEKRFLSEFLAKHRNLGTGDLRKTQTQNACRLPRSPKLVPLSGTEDIP